MPIVKVTITPDARLVAQEIKVMDKNIIRLLPQFGIKTTGQVAKYWKQNVQPFSWKEGGSRLFRLIKAYKAGKNRFVVDARGAPEAGAVEEGMRRRPHLVSLRNKRAKLWVKTKLMRRNPKVAKIILRRGWMHVGAGYPGSGIVPGGRHALDRAIGRVQKDIKDNSRKMMDKIIRR